MNLLLRDVVESDLPTLFDQQMDPEANAMARFPARERETFMAHWKKILADHTSFKLAIVVDGVLAGNLVCWEQKDRWLVGYWIGKAHWGKGIASRALGDVLTRFTTRPLHAYVAPHNAGSIRVLEKSGFVLKAREDDDLLFELDAQR